MQTTKQFFAVRISNRVAALAFFAVLILLFASMFLSHNHSGSDQACCVIYQRNIQQAIRHYEDTNSLHVGDTIDWQKIIGVGQYIESYPVCPIHGRDAYHYSPTIPPVGVLAASCKDIAHKPSHIKDW